MQPGIDTVYVHGFKDYLILMYVHVLLTLTQAFDIIRNLRRTGHDVCGTPFMYPRLQLMLPFSQLTKALILFKCDIAMSTEKADLSSSPGEGLIKNNHAMHFLFASD